MGIIDSIARIGLETKVAPVQPTYPYGRDWSATVDYRLNNFYRLPDEIDGSNNSAVVACLQVLATRFPEAPLKTWDEMDPLPVTSQATDLVSDPNPWMIEEMLWTYAMYALHIDGNAYYFKARNRARMPVEIHPLLPDLIEPRGTKRRTITHYRYTPDGQEIDIPARDIIHLRIGLDPHDHRVGMAPLKSAMREVFGDDEAAKFGTALLTNTGVAPVLISPKDDEGPDEEEGERIIAKWEERVGGSRRGSALFLNGPVNVDKLAFSPSDLDLTSLRRLPEERIAAVIGVPPILAGLGAGIEQSSGRNETQELIESFTEGKLVPMWRVIGAWFTKQLLREFTEDGQLRMGFDLTDVRALQSDETDLFNRYNIGVQGRWVTIAEARAAVGLPTTAEQEVFTEQPTAPVAKEPPSVEE